MADKHSSGSLDIGEMFKVKDYKCVVTGGGTGIGLMIAQGLARNGAIVYITGRRKEALDKVVETYSKGNNHGKIIAMQCDHTSKDDLQKLAQAIEKKEPHGLQLLVNNAGIAPEDATRGKTPDNKADPKKVQEWMWGANPEEWRSTFDVNVTAQYFTAAAFVPLLVKGSKAVDGHSPSIINITSVSGLVKSGNNGQFAYAASKAAMIHLTRQLASTLAPLRIRVNSIAPGLFPSEMTAREPADKDNQKSYLPQGEREWPARRAGDEADIASAVIWLASVGGVFHNGQNVILDGGLTLTSPSAA